MDEGRTSAADQLAWIALPIAAVASLPFVAIASFDAWQELLGFGLFDPQRGGDPVLVEHTKPLAIPALGGGALAVVAGGWLLRRAFKLRAVPARLPRAAGVMAVAVGVTFLLPFIVLGTTRLLTPDDSGWTFYTPYQTTMPSSDVLWRTAQLLTVPGLLVGVGGVCAVVAGVKSGDRAGRATAVGNDSGGFS